MGYRVITPPAAEPITLEEAKMHLKVSEPDEDALIRTFIAAARGMLEQRTNRKLMLQTIEFSPEYWGPISIPAAPFVALSSVSYTDAAGAPAVLDPLALYVNPYAEPATVALTWPSLYSGSRPVVRAVVGYASAEDVPAELKAWMLLAIGTLYENRASVIAGVSVAELPEDFMKMLWHPYMVYL